MIDSRRISVPEVASHYDELDAFYRSIWGNHVHHGVWCTGRETVDEATANLVELVADGLAIGPGARVVDIGCGYGETARVLARTRGARVTGFTISSKQFEFASAQPAAEPTPEYRLGDWMTNDLPTGAFDAAYAIESSEHMPDFARFFAECARVLRPGGRLVICAWLEADDVRGWRREHLLQALCDEGRMRMGTRAEYEAELARHGFTVRSYEDLSSSVSRTWTIVLRRAAARLVTDADFRRVLFSRASANREFAKTLLRIRLAFASGVMRYGVFVAAVPHSI